MAVFRVEKTRDYTVMANHHLRNTDLSLKAKGLLSLMLSLPENWDYTTKGLAKICKDGVDSICSTVKELEEHGYTSKDYCTRCARPDGSMESFEEKKAKMIAFIVKTQGLDETVAENAAVAMMKKLPAWKDCLA